MKTILVRHAGHFGVEKTARQMNQPTQKMIPVTNPTVIHFASTGRLPSTFIATNAQLKLTAIATKATSIERE